jgi:UDP-N-acetylmuramate--alanine ligase
MRHVHFIGIGGIGMSALAYILLEKGVTVSGSDAVANYLTEALAKKGATIFIGHSAENVSEGAFVVYSTAVTGKNPEFMRAKKLGLRLFHRSEMLGLLMEGVLPLLVTGTHGKTTTSSLLAHVLVKSRLSPSYAIGGKVSSLGANGGYGEGGYFVAEADESDGSFLKYPGFGAIVTNIDNDHLDYWKTNEALLDGFKQFVEKIDSKKHLFWCADDALLSSLRPEGTSYGFSSTASLKVHRFSQEGWRMFYDISFEGKEYTRVEVPLIGRHNVLNSAAVFGLCLRLKISADEIRSAFLSFEGIARRVEKKGEVGGTPIYDDYGHHPTEIAATLKALKTACPNKRLVVVFQPHRYTRTRDCLEQFAQVFGAADALILTDIYSAGEKPIPGITIELLKEKIQESRNTPMHYVPRTSLADFLTPFLQASSDVLVTMGAGDVTKLASELMQ